MAAAAADSSTATSWFRLDVTVKARLSDSLPEKLLCSGVEIEPKWSLIRVFVGFPTNKHSDSCLNASLNAVMRFSDNNMNFVVTNPLSWWLPKRTPLAKHVHVLLDGAFKTLEGDDLDPELEVLLCSEDSIAFTDTHEPPTTRADVKLSYRFPSRSLSLNFKRMLNRLLNYSHGFDEIKREYNREMNAQVLKRIAETAIDDDAEMKKARPDEEE
jgi:hypothetical protein